MNSDSPTNPEKDAVYIRRLHYIGAVVWPSFLSACIGTMVFFAMFDPVELGHITTWPIELNRQWGYTIGFFLLWLLTASASFTTWFLLKPVDNKAEKEGGDTDE